MLLRAPLKSIFFWVGAPAVPDGGRRRGEVREKAGCVAGAAARGPDPPKTHWVEAGSAGKLIRRDNAGEIGRAETRGRGSQSPKMRGVDVYIRKNTTSER